MLGLIERVRCVAPPRLHHPPIATCGVLLVKKTKPQFLLAWPAEKNLFQCTATSDFTCDARRARSSSTLLCKTCSCVTTRSSLSPSSARTFPRSCTSTAVFLEAPQKKRALHSATSSAFGLRWMFSAHREVSEESAPSSLEIEGFGP